MRLERTHARNVTTVNQQDVAICPLTVHPDGSGAFAPRTGGRHTGLQTEQVQVTAAVQWQLHDFLLLDDVAELGVSGFNLDWIGTDSDFLLAGGDLQNDVNAAPIVDGENNPTHDKRPKSGG